MSLSQRLLFAMYHRVENMMYRLAILLSIGLWTAGTACADVMLVQGADVTWFSHGQSLLDYVIGIESTADGTGTVDSLMGWQLTCMIIRHPSATGTIGFGSVMPPADYVLAGKSASFAVYDCGSPNPFATSGLIASSGLMSDFVPAGSSGATVPRSGAGLVHIALTASSNAAGTFDIAVLPDADPNSPDYMGAGWFDGDGAERAFFGMPFGTAPVVIGSVTIASVPEPCAIILAWPVGCAIPYLVSRRFRKSGYRFPQWSGLIASTDRKVG